MPLISFVVAVYNNEKYLPSAVGSIVDQKIEDRRLIEVIIIDDGSTDKTPEIADRLSEEDDRISVVHQSNQWIYASFNNGINVAKGEYIYILNSDDKLMDGAVQLLIDNIKKYNKPDVLWTKVLWQDVDENQNVINERDINDTVVKDEYIDIISGIHDKWLEIQKSGLAVNQANLYKRELALMHPFRNDVYGADTLFNLNIADSIKSMAILKDSIYIYMSYNNPTMNASVGKYYAYEHEMFNDMAKANLKLYDKWSLTKEEYIDYVALKRLKDLSYEIESLHFENCNLPMEERLLQIFMICADPFVRKLASRSGREREYESRILNGAKELIDVLGITRDKIPEFIYILINYLPDYYLDDVNAYDIDIDKVKVAIDDKYNRDNIGRIYYYSKW